jgi:hypothetical protein
MSFGFGPNNKITKLRKHDSLFLTDTKTWLDIWKIWKKKLSRLKIMHNCNLQLLGIRNWIKQIRRNNNIDSQSFEIEFTKKSKQRNEELGREIDEF